MMFSASFYYVDKKAAGRVCNSLQEAGLLEGR